MTIHGKAPDEHFLMLPLVFQFRFDFWGKCIFWWNYALSRTDVHYIWTEYSITWNYTWCYTKYRFIRWQYATSFVQCPLSTFEWTITLWTCTENWFNLIPPDVENESLWPSGSTDYSEILKWTTRFVEILRRVLVFSTQKITLVFSYL
jgi:hypothetical protein